ncbi:MAG: hypothetical protein FD131_287 [Rhodocyclaceae bacterium]|nr:MAG: hypothetical protein FD131_287 [Rhodocyclaceae bacterium]
MLNDELIIDCSSAQVKLAGEIAAMKVGEFKTIELSPADVLDAYPAAKLKPLIEWAKEDKGCRFIYIFTMQTEKDPALLLQRFKAMKQQHKEAKSTRMFARPIQPSRNLYVGSSASLESRIKQHLGYRDKTLYSMQLCHWLKPDSIKSITLKVWKFPSTIPQTVLQAIEDHLWLKAQPMLGKQGGK